MDGGRALVIANSSIRVLELWASVPLVTILALLLFLAVAGARSRGGQRDGDRWARHIALGGVLGLLVLHAVAAKHASHGLYGLSILGPHAGSRDYAFAIAFTLDPSMVGWLIALAGFVGALALHAGRARGASAGWCLLAVAAAIPLVGVNAGEMPREFEARWEPRLGIPHMEVARASSCYPPTVWFTNCAPLTAFGLPIAAFAVLLYLASAARSLAARSRARPLVFGAATPWVLGAALALAVLRVQWLAYDRANVSWVPETGTPLNLSVRSLCLGKPFLHEAWPAAVTAWAALLGFVLLAWMRSRSPSAPPSGSTSGP